jgi:hypothetical protein
MSKWLLYLALVLIGYYVLPMVLGSRGKSKTS